MRYVMTEGTEIFQQYADHLAKKAASVVVSLAVVGAVGGALLAAVPGLLGHSVVSPGANYFLVLLGAIAGGIMGRSFGEKRAVGIRFQAQMALHQANIEQQGAVAPRPAAPAPAPAAAAPPAAAPAAVPVPVSAPAPAVPLVPIVPLVAPAPALVPVSPVVAAPTPKPLEPAPLSVPPLFGPAPPAAPAVAPALAPPASPPAPAGPRLVEPLPLPPEPLLLPPLSAQR
jgi:hypothetical protein